MSAIVKIDSYQPSDDSDVVYRVQVGTDVREYNDLHVALLAVRFAVEVEPESDCCDGTGWTGDPRVPCAEHYQTSF